MNVFELLTAFLLRPCALAAAAWLLLRVFGIRHPASRHAAWTAVLVATLLLPPLTLLTPKLTLRVLPAKIIPAATIPTADVAPVSEPVVSIETIPETAKSQTPQRHWPTPRTLTIWLCFAGFIAMLAYRLVAWIVLRKIMSGAKRIHRFLYQSNDVLTPVTCGVLQPSIILPTDWRTWPTETRRAALAHEYAHIRRRDTLTLALTRFATSIYWFHPLTWWLAREISNQAELSCDAAVLEKSGDAKTYSRILLAFAEKVTEAQHRIALPRMAFATASGMSQRIDRIFELSGGNLRKLSRPGLLLALSGLPLTALIAAVALGSPIPHSKQPEPKLLSQSKPAPATTDTQSLTIPAPNAQPTKPPQRLETLSSFTPTDSENAGDALLVNGTLPRLIAQSDPAPPRPSADSPATAQRLKFEVASVKVHPMQPNSFMFRRYSSTGPPQPFRPTGNTWTSRDHLRDLVMEAYGVFDYQISGIPDWGLSPGGTVYDIEAKAAGTDTPTNDQLRQMLQSLLADRFQLRLHRETKELPVYALVIGKNGSKLQKLPDDYDLPRGPADPLAPTEKGEFSGLFSLIRLYLDRPLVDETGITGKYESPSIPWREFTTEQRTDPMAARNSVFAAVQDRLGLKLEPRKENIEVLVIDHVEAPSPN